MGFERESIAESTNRRRMPGPDDDACHEHDEGPAMRPEPISL